MPAKVFMAQVQLRLHTISELCSSSTQYQNLAPTPPKLAGFMASNSASSDLVDRIAQFDHTLTLSHKNSSPMFGLLNDFCFSFRKGYYDKFFKKVLCSLCNFVCA